MSTNTDILHEAKRLRLLAAALELQHYTSTAANVVPIPGGERVIAIGTPAQVARLLEIAPAVATEGELPPKPHTTYNGYSDGSEPLWTGEQMEDYARATLALRAWNKSRVTELATNIAVEVAKNASTVSQLTFPHIYLGLLEALVPPAARAEKLAGLQQLADQAQEMGGYDAPAGAAEKGGA